MAGSLIEFRSDELRRALQRAQRRCHNMTPAWAQVGEHMLVSVDDNFAAEGRPTKWQVWSSATLESKMGGRGKTYTKKGALRVKANKRLNSDNILTDSGRLRNSITYRADSGGVQVGTNAKYAAIHQFGGKAGRNKSVTIVKREYLLIQGEDELIIARIIEDYIIAELAA